MHAPRLQVQSIFFFIFHSDFLLLICRTSYRNNFPSIFHVNWLTFFSGGFLRNDFSSSTIGLNQNPIDTFVHLRTAKSSRPTWPNDERKLLISFQFFLLSCTLQYVDNLSLLERIYRTMSNNMHKDGWGDSRKNDLVNVWTWMCAKRIFYCPWDSRHLVAFNQSIKASKHWHFSCTHL